MFPLGNAYFIGCKVINFVHHDLALTIGISDSGYRWLSESLPVKSDYDLGEFGYDFRRTPGSGGLGTASRESVRQLAQFFVSVIFQTGQILETHRIGQLGRPVCLVEIQPDSHYGEINHSGTDAVLHKYPADLLLTDPDVIRPLYPRFDALSVQIIAYSKSHYGCHGESIRSFQTTVPEQYGEGEILSRRRMPDMVTLAASRRLRLGRND